ncbi:L,D-transpeptidase [Nocardioides sp. 1609]|uniref:L,D-transpeptidase n=1 Tax=Nocardioides sp. 1609 TaxID=2508327 RepID=UPI00106F5749|nr:L,D-transpeptidase [Nocardioides sp. 1609]
MSRHRMDPPPRYRARQGRLVVLGVSLATTAVALLGSIGVLPSAADDEPQGENRAAVAAADVAGDADDRGARDAVATAAPTSEPSAPTSEPSAPTSEPSAPTSEPGASDEESTSGAQGPSAEETATVLPADSGTGRRVVFSEGRQRVWLVGADDEIERTYLVSGSLTDNLDPGTYEVYSRSEDAIGIDDSGTMEWFVRFTQGDTGAAIGFHTIPVDDGARVQTKAQLGTPQSHGCIRQATPDALALWDFAPLGTTVVVTA